MRLSDDAPVLVRRHDKVVYLDGDRVVKVFSGDKHADDVFNEALNLSRVERCHILIPPIAEVSQVEGGRHDGAWALATSYVPGHSLRELLLGRPEEVDSYLSQFVDLQALVHDCVAPALTKQRDKLARMISGTRGLLDASTRYELHLRLDGMRAEERVCHGDFVPSNVIVGADGRLYLCDWAHVTAGLPEVDAAMTYLRLRMNYPDFARRYLELFCSRADVAYQLVEHWLPVVAAAELSRGRKEHQDFLLGWADLRRGLDDLV